MLSKCSLTTEPLSMKGIRDMYLTDVTCTVNAVHKTRLDSSKIYF